MQKNLAYETADRGVFDYNLSGEEFGTFSNFRNFDGKQKDIVCLGAAQTFGRFSHNPFPALVEDNSEYSVANFGWGGVGDYEYNAPDFLDYINSSKLCVYQVNSGRSTKNFDETFGFEKTLIADRVPKLIDLYQNNFSDFELKFDKNKEEYLNSVKDLIQQIKVPILFVFIAKHCLDDVDEMNVLDGRPMELIWNFPQLVTKQMVEEITKGYEIGCFKQSKITRLPKPIPGIASPQNNKIFATSNYYPDQTTHYDVAEFVITKIKNTL